MFKFLLFYKKLGGFFQFPFVLREGGVDESTPQGASCWHYEQTFHKILFYRD